MKKQIEQKLDYLKAKHGLPADISIKITNMKRSAGKYVGAKKEIRISKHLIENHPEQVEPTLKHELGHVLVDQRYGAVKPHGKEWKKAMAELGVGNPSICHNLKLAEYRYIVKCSNCDVSFGRYRKSKIVKHPERYRCRECGSAMRSISNLT